jgi:hypothetical protein
VKAGYFADAVRAARLKRCCFLLWYFVNVAEHLTRSGEVETAFWPQFSQGGEDVVSAVDVHVHRREAVGEAFRDEALGRQVVTLVEVMLAQDLKNAWVTFETGRMECYAFEQMGNAAEASIGRLEGDASHQAVNFITESEEVIGEVTPVLPGDSGNQRSFGHGVDCTVELSEKHRFEVVSEFEVSL